MPFTTRPRSSEVTVHMAQILWGYCPHVPDPLRSLPHGPDSLRSLAAHTAQIPWGHCPHNSDPLRSLSTQPRSSEITAHDPEPLRSLPMAQVLWGHCPWPRSSAVTAHMAQFLWVHCLLHFEFLSVFTKTPFLCIPSPTSGSHPRSPGPPPFSFFL